jgi:hypothetical protein
LIRSRSAASPHVRAHIAAARLRGEHAKEVALLTASVGRDGGDPFGTCVHSQCQCGLWTSRGGTRWTDVIFRRPVATVNLDRRDKRPRYSRPDRVKEPPRRFHSVPSAPVRWLRMNTPPVIDPLRGRPPPDTWSVGGLVSGDVPLRGITTSAKSAVTCLYSAAAVVGVIGAPHLLQNLAVSPNSVPHDPHTSPGAASVWPSWRSATARRTCTKRCTDSHQGRASKIRLNGVCIARRNRVNPPSSTITLLNRRSPACAPSAGPRRASDTGTQISDDAP